jgi:hypothetical protein
MLMEIVNQDKTNGDHRPLAASLHDSTDKTDTNVIVNCVNCDAKVSH